MATNMENSIFNGNQKLIETIGQGAFGCIYKSQDTQTKQYYAIKLEKRDQTESVLHHEFTVSKNLQIHNKKQKGFAKVQKQGIEGEQNQMLMELLGPSIEAGATEGTTQDIDQVVMVVMQIIDALQQMHDNHYIHRDIKPENFIFDQDKQQVHVIDFGLSKKYRDSHTFKHIAYTENRPFIGTARFTSLNVHLGIEQSRRDDFESIGQLIIYMLKGKLPWQGVKAANKEEKQDRIKDMKLILPLEKLCEGLPYEILLYMKYIRNINFEDRPDYNYLKRIFQNFIVGRNFKVVHFFTKIGSKSDLNQIQNENENEECKEIIN